MNNRKNQHSILVLAELCFYFCVVFAVAAQTVFSQATRAGDPIIDKKPLRDFAGILNKKVKTKAVDLDAPFLVEVTGTLDKKGKFKVAAFKRARIDGDKESAKMALNAIRAVEQSGYLQYLATISTKSITVRLAQDGTDFHCDVSMVSESDNRARSVTSSLNMVIAVAKMTKNRQNADQNDKDDLLMLESAKVDAEGKKVIIRFTVPKEIALPMIRGKLAEQENATKAPNGNAIIKPNTNVGK